MSTYYNQFFKVTSSSLLAITVFILCYQPTSAQKADHSKQTEKVSAVASESISELEIIRNTSSLIDKAIASDLIERKLQPHPLIDDQTFLRRTYIGIIGRIPTFLESRSFLHSSDINKRTKLIDKLISSTGFESKMFNF